MQFLLFFLIGKLFTLTVGIIYYRSLPLSYRLVFFLTLIAALTESVGYYLANYVRQQNIWLFNLYMLVEIWLMGLAVIYMLTNYSLRKIFIALLILVTAIWAKTILSNTIFQFANIAYIISCAVLTVMYIAVLLSNSVFNTKKIFKQPIFWLSVSSVLYFSCVIPVMGLFNYLSKNASLAHDLNFIIRVLDIIRYPLIGISFILLGRQRTAEPKVAEHGIQRY